MTEREWKVIAKEIQLMKDLVPDYMRLWFAEGVANAIRFTGGFPRWPEFLRLCDLTGNEKKPEE